MKVNYIRKDRKGNKGQMGKKGGVSCKKVSCRRESVLCKTEKMYITFMRKHNTT